MIPKKPAPDAIRGGYRFSEKIMLQQQAGSAVGQEVFLDVVAVGLEHDPRAAKLADLLVGSLDHAVTLARHRRQHLAGAGDLEALLGARFRLHLGHLARLLDRPETGGRSRAPVAAGCARMSRFG